MKKVFLAVLIVFCAAAAYAGTYVDPLTGPTTNRDKIYPKFGTPLVQFDISGEFDARGYYWDNFDMRNDSKATPTVQHSYFRGWLDLWPKLKVGDTQLITKIQMVDQNPWAKFNQTVGNETFDKNYDVPNTTSKKNNISVERAYIHHDFNDKVSTDVGLMNGQTWGTTFQDYQMPRWRVLIQGMTPVGAVVGIYEKNTEVGSAIVEDSEKDDYNAYALGGITKVGDFTIEPLFYYHVDSAFYRYLPVSTTTSRVISGQDGGSDGAKILYISLASKGKVGSIGMEGEVCYKKYDVNNLTGTTTIAPSTPGGSPTVLTDIVDNDWVELGAYLNVWNVMDFGTVGGKFAYGNWDKKGGILKDASGKYTGVGADFREDFKSNLILGDEMPFGVAGSNVSQPEDLIGMTLLQPYIKGVKLGVDKLTGSASFGYIMSNQKDTVYEDASAWEFDLGVQYKLTDNFLYKIDGGYASISVDDDSQPANTKWANGDPDPIMCIKHEILLTF